MITNLYDKVVVYAYKHKLEKGRSQDIIIIETLSDFHGFSNCYDKMGFYFKLCENDLLDSIDDIIRYNLEPVLINRNEDVSLIDKIFKTAQDAGDYPSEDLTKLIYNLKNILDVKAILNLGLGSHERN